MSERQLAGKDLLLYRGNGESSSETFDLVACLTSTDFNQTSSTLSADTKCGVLKKQGTHDSTVPFALIPNLSAASGKVHLETLQADYKSGTPRNWKATTVAPATGDPILSFFGFVTEFSLKAGTNDFFNATGTIQPDANGIGLVVYGATYNSTISFASSATPSAIHGVSGTASTTDADQSFRFDAITGTLTSLPISMAIKVGGVQECLIDAQADYIGYPFEYIDKLGVHHLGNFIDGVINF